MDIWTYRHTIQEYNITLPDVLLCKPLRIKK